MNRNQNSHRGVCLVTGGAGFIGCSASRALADRFGRVVALDSLHAQVHPRRRRPQALDRRVELVVGDVTQPAVWDDLLDDVAPDVVIHLAAETGTGQSLLEATRHAHVNVTGTTQMLDAFARHQRLPRRIVLTSSRAVYGEGAWRDATTSALVYPGQRTRAQLESAEWDFSGMDPVAFSASTTDARPISVYGATKLAQEQVLRAWACAFGIEAVVLRLQNVYGPGQSLHNPYTGICTLFARLARAGKSLPVYEDGRIVRDFVFIDDVVNALLASLNVAGAALAYDIGSGSATTIAHLADLVARLYGAPSPHINGAFRHGDVRHAACSIEQATRELGWQPKVPLADGIGRLCAWIDAEVEQPRQNATAA
ncbi:MAG TPA: NAD-dependent epimerase/dehydratase family protein [Dokdonella sp.]